MTTAHEFYSREEAEEFVAQAQRRPEVKSITWKLVPYLERWRSGYVEQVPEWCKVVVEITLIDA